jgi:deazaflavin-dependent oxidoreductase (nitroreductase family)
MSKFSPSNLLADSDGILGGGREGRVPVAEVGETALSFAFSGSTMAIAILILILAVLFSATLLMRFRKRWLAKFNLAITNRITSQFAAKLPGFGIITNLGRKSGRVYRTPVNVFRGDDGFAIALTYGREAEWVKNVLAAGGCQLEAGGVLYQLSAPTLVHDPTRKRFPFPARIILTVAGANDYMQLAIARTG